MKKLCLISAGLLLLSGCATQPVPTEQATMVPQIRIIDMAYTTEKEGSASLIVKRDSGFAGSGCNVRIYIDSQPIADIDRSEKIKIYVQPGEYTLSVEPTSICVAGLKEIPIKVNSDDSKVYRIGYSGNSELGIYQTRF